MVNFVTNLLEKFDKEGKTLKSLEKMGINNYDDGDDEPDKIPMHHLGFCLLGFILHTRRRMTTSIMMRRRRRMATRKEVMTKNLNSSD